MDERETTSSIDHHGDLFEPEILLPTQFFTKLRGCAAHDGERRLLLAILEDAIGCFRKYLAARDNRGRRLFREAQGWIMSEDREYPFSFENICDCLQLNPAYIRQGMREWARVALLQAERDMGTEPDHARRPAGQPTPVTAVRGARAPGGVSAASGQNRRVSGAA